MSVGIGQMHGGHGFRVVRQRSAKLRALRELDAQVLVTGVRGIAIEVIDVDAPPVPLVKLRSSTLGPQAGQPTLAEQARLRPLCAGAQLQNWDCDAREGLIAAGELEVGTLGTLGYDHAGGWLVSNNHVLAGQNRGRVGDRIAQPGGARLDDGDVVATLERFVELRPSPSGAQPRRGNVVWNRVDAALARTLGRVAPGHPERPEIAAPRLGDEVFKIGRTTGLTRGRIVSVSDRVGPVGYELGHCWFKDSFTIESLDGSPFSDSGDSGATIVRGDGTVLGLLYAGNGALTYACPIDAVLEELGL